jgi:hypothetical protein
VWPKPSILAISLALLAALLAVGAGIDGARIASAVLGIVAFVLAWRIAGDCGVSLGALDEAVRRSAHA